MWKIPTIYDLMITSFLAFVLGAALSSWVIALKIETVFIISVLTIVVACISTVNYVWHNRKM